MPVFLLLSLFVVVIDQLMKLAIIHNLKIGESIEVLSGVLSLTSHRNSGAAFGILQNQTWFLITVTAIVIIAMGYYLRKIHLSNKMAAFGLSLVLGGAVGNFSDRIIRGEVVDMIEVTFIDYPIFNMADSFIFIGCVFLMIGLWKTPAKGVLKE